MGQVPRRRVVSGSAGVNPRPNRATYAERLVVGGGLRFTLGARPRMQVTASSGVHRYTTGDVAEHALFFGLAVGQAWTLAEHVEIGWELAVRRVSAYEKDRYVPLFDVTRHTTHNAEYLGALAFTVGGVF